MILRPKICTTRIRLTAPALKHNLSPFYSWHLKVVIIGIFTKFCEQGISFRRFLPFRRNVNRFLACTLIMWVHDFTAIKGFLKLFHLDSIPHFMKITIFAENQSIKSGPNFLDTSYWKYWSSMSVLHLLQLQN